MPRIEMAGPPIHIDRTRVLAKRLTHVASEVYGLRPSLITVVIREDPPENVAIGGVLIADRKPD